MAVRMKFLIILLLWSIKVFAQPLKNTCPSRCGNVTIDYPFGIGPGCYLESSFSIVCNQSFQPPKPFLKSLDLEVLSISAGNSTIRVNAPTFFTCARESRLYVSLGGSNFFISASRNKFVARGCGNHAWVVVNGTTIAGCMSLCSKNSVVDGSICNGVNCCQTTSPLDLVAFTTYMWTPDLTDIVVSCKSAFLVEEEWLQSVNTSASVSWSQVPVVLGWWISETSFRSLSISYEKTFSSLNMSSSVQLVPSSIYTCSKRTRDGNLTYTCDCNRGFSGNPYVSDGCKDIDECQDPNNFNCSSNYKCTNNYGSYNCDPNGVQTHIKLLTIGVSTSLGLLVLLLGGWLSCILLEKMREIERKKNFFKRNGGLLLQQKLSSHEADVENIKLFNSKDLEKATDHFNVNGILGQGGQGTVYKGILANGRIVAVKKFKAIDEGKLQEFINEVIILSQINHRNVVKLLGFCLETEVPFLVYEYVPNGTLSQYLDNQSEKFLPAWNMRLRIATEVAGALYYLHSIASSPIYHRDIKSANILLDDKYRAKVADFGTSRSITIDQTHLTTLVRGTFGYLDPEYFRLSQFTEKSDVYSFGVVLAKLLTGEKAISSTRKEISLATYFIQSMEENKLFDILDSQVLKEDKKEEMIAVANLVKRCLSLKGKRRPTMKEVTIELEAIQIYKKGLNIHQNHEKLEYIKTEMNKPWGFATTSTFGIDSVTNLSIDTHSLLFLSL